VRAPLPPIPQALYASSAVAPAVAPTTTTKFAVSSGATVQGKIEAIRHSLDGTHVADFAPGAYAGKNVIIIQVESLNGFVVGKRYRGKEITPNLDKLINESWYWPNAFSETGMGNTADAEFIVNTSLYAPTDQACAVKYANRRLTSLPNVLRPLGYYSFTIHQNKVTYWNRNQLYKALGFDRYYDRSFFQGDPFMGEFGTSDENLYKRGTTVLTGLKKKGTHFYAHFISLSSHEPFVAIPEKRRPLRSPNSSLVGHYMSAESYSDMALGQFFKRLKNAGLWDDSIIVIYGDHTAMTSNTLSGANASLARALLGRAYRPIDRQRIPLIIHLPGQTTPVLRTEVAGQVDIMPSVADLTGADISGVPHMGRSLFVDSDPLVPLTAYLPGKSFLNYRILCVPRGSGKFACYRVPDGAGTGMSASDRADYSHTLTLRKISDSWVMSLKKFNAGKKGWIPDPVARAAAAKYGFTQH
jgi:lipoteichoic acid synthase